MKNLILDRANEVASEIKHFNHEITSTSEDLEKVKKIATGVIISIEVDKEAGIPAMESMLNKYKKKKAELEKEFEAL